MQRAEAEMDSSAKCPDPGMIDRSRTFPGSHNPEVLLRSASREVLQQLEQSAAARAASLLEQAIALAGLRHETSLVLRGRARKERSCVAPFRGRGLREEAGRSLSRRAESQGAWTWRSQMGPTGPGTLPRAAARACSPSP